MVKTYRCYRLESQVLQEGREKDKREIQTEEEMADGKCKGRQNQREKLQEVSGKHSQDNADKMGERDEQK